MELILFTSFMILRFSTQMRISSQIWPQNRIRRKILHEKHVWLKKLPKVNHFIHLIEIFVDLSIVQTYTSYQIFTIFFQTLSRIYDFEFHCWIF